MPHTLASLFPKAGQIPAEHDLASPQVQEQYLVQGLLKPWTGETQTVLSPVCVDAGNGPAPREIGVCPVLDEAAALEAVDAADKAWDQGRGPWATMRVHDRIRCVRNFAMLMREKRDEVVRLMMWEICKSLPDARAEFDRTVDYIQDTIDALKDLDRASSRFVIEKGIYAQIRRAPLGPVLCMGPFNYPLNETFTTLIPALIMGNPAIVKTPRVGKLLFGPLLEAFAEAFPPGVVNVLFGDRRIVGPMMRTGKIGVLAFIGSSKAADALRVMHPHPHRLRCILGLDAKNSAIVMDCADMDLTVQELMSGSLSFNGQRCTAIKLVFAHESRAEELLDRLRNAIEALPMGMPWDQGVKITPLAEAGKPAYLQELIQDARNQGAEVLNAGGGESERALFRPALVARVNNATRLFHEEQFGPAVPVTTFKSLDEPIEAVIRSNFGQQMSIFGSDPEQVAALIDPMVNQVCRVNLNSQCQRGPDTFPFTGRKDSAEGTLSVTDALRCFSIRTLVAAKGTDANRAMLTDILRKRRSSFLSTDFLL